MLLRPEEAALTHVSRDINGSNSSPLDDSRRAGETSSPVHHSGTEDHVDEKLFFVVPFNRKGEAKALGLQWDSRVGKWYSKDPATIAKAMLLL
jgi:Domain of unknown function (DUF5710)